MKKLMAMIGAVAMAFGLYADGYGTLEYSPAGLADGTKTIVGYTDDATTPYTTAGSVINWWSTNCQEETFEQPATVVAPEGGTSYLQIETDGTPMLRTFNQVELGDSAAQAIEPHGLFVDMKVQLTGFEPDSEVKTGDGNKLLVWLKAGEVEDGGDGVTNLMVTCGYWDKGEVTPTNYVLVAKDGSDLDVKPGDWVQFTVRANKGTENVPTFNIYVNQQQVKAIVDGEDLLAFPSLIGGASELVLKAAGFEGNGAIENVNLYGQANAPAWAADPTIMNIVWDANVKSLKINDVDVIAAGEDSPLAYPVPFGETITAEIEYADGYRKGSVTGTGANLSEFTETDDGATFKVAQYATVADAQLAVVSERDRDEAVLTLNGEPVTEAGTSLAGILTYLNTIKSGSYKITLGDSATLDEIALDALNYLEGFEGTLEIDLHGCTVTAADVEELTEDDFIIINNGTLTIGDSIGGGKIIAPALAGGVLYNWVELTLNPATTGEEIVYIGAVVNDCFYGEAATMNVNGGIFSVKPTTSEEDYPDEGIVLPDDMEWKQDAQSGYWYLGAAEPPVPGEKGFKVIISGVETQVDTLAEAFAQADDGTTITFLANVTDATGMTVDTKKTLTVDFAGFTYTVNKPGAGSPSTMTQAFQLLKGQTLTFKNGTIRASVDNLVLATEGKNIKRFFQSYANFTLENMTLDGTNLYLNPTDNAMCEFANGTVAITGDTTILANKENLDAISIDTWKGKYPDGVNVTIDTTGTISSVKVWTEGTGDFTPGEVALDGGTITELKVDGNDADYAITKSEDVTITTTPAGYFWDNGALVKCAAEINGTYYNTLAAAFTAAQADDEIVLLKDIKLEAPIAVDKKVTLNIGDFDITPKAAFTRPTGSKITIDAMFAVRYGGDFTVVGGEGVIDCSAFPTIYSPIKLTEYDETETYDGSTKAKLTVNANLKGYYYAITGNGKRPGTEITINGGLLEGTLVNESAGIYHPQGGTLTINGGTIKGDTGLYIKAGDCICSVGSGAKIIATGTKKDYVAKKSGFQSTGDAFLIDNADYPGGEPSADIEGGEFVSANGAAVASYAKAGFDPIVGFVEGGTFTGAVKIDDAIAGGDYAFGPFTPGEPQTLVDAVAKVNDVNYATFDAAWAAAQENDEITLLADCTFGTATSAQVKLNKNLKLTLNGKVLTVKNKKYDRIYVIDDKTLTVDGSVEGSKLIGTLYAGIKSGDNYIDGNIVINGGTYVASDHNKYGLAAIQSNGTCDNSSITATDATFIGGNQSLTVTEANRDQQSIAAVLAAGGTYAFTGCSFTGHTAVYAKAGTVTLEDCDLAATGWGFDPEPSGNGSDSTGDAIVLDSNKAYKGNISLDVDADTTATSVYGYGLVEAVTKGTESTTLSISVAEDANIGVVKVSDEFAAKVKSGDAEITGYAASVNNTAWKTVGDALVAVKILEDAEDFPITVAALAADGITITDSDRTAKIAAGVTITIPEAKHWTVNGVLGYAGAIEGTVAAEDIEKIENADITIGKDATVAVGLASSVNASFFTSSDESCEVKQIAVTDTYKIFALETKMLTLTVKEVEHTMVEVKYNETTDTTNGVYTLAYGTEYKVTYTPVAGYKGDSTHQGTLFENTMVSQPKPTAINYNITYVFNGVEEGDKSKVVNDNPATYTVEDAITFVDASCEGYTFTGWDITKIDAGTTGNQTITGTFEKAEDPLPPWVPSGEKEAYNTWKTTGPGATESDFTGTDAEIAKKMEDSFLLNCAPTEAALQTAKANFKITSITKDASGNWVVLTVGQEDNTAYGNGLIKLEAFESVGCTGTPVTPGTQPQLFWKASLVHPTAN